MGVNSAASDGGIGLQGVVCVLRIHLASQTGLKSNISRVLRTHLIVNVILQRMPVGRVVSGLMGDHSLIRVDGEAVLAELSVLSLSILHASEVLSRAVYFALLHLLLLLL